MTRRRAGLFAAAAVLVLAGALALRLAYVDATPLTKLIGDGRDYDAHALSIAQGEGYSDTLAYGRPTAFRPPGYTYALGALYRLTDTDRRPLPERILVARRAQTVVGTALVALTGLVALQVWGAAIGLLALALAAVYVPLVTMSGTVMSEPLFTVLMLGALSAALRMRRSAHRYRWALLVGLLAGGAILTRANGMILLVPLALAALGPPPRLRLAALGPPATLVAVAVLAVVPWTIRNERTLHAFVPVSTQLGSALAGTYNEDARTDPRYPGSWRPIKRTSSNLDLYVAVRRWNEARLERELRRRALRYIGHHPLYVAQVGFWTTVRGLDLDGLDLARRTALYAGVDAPWADRGARCFWVFAVLALAGTFTRRARRAPWLVWAFPLAMYLSVVLLVIETPRYRTPIDPFVVMLAALALAAAADRVRGRAAAPRPVERPAESTVPA